MTKLDVCAEMSVYVDAAKSALLKTRESLAYELWLILLRGCRGHPYVCDRAHRIGRTIDRTHVSAALAAGYSRRVVRAPRELAFGFSPCPNDTFAFWAAVHGEVDASVAFEPDGTVSSGSF